MIAARPTARIESPRPSPPSMPTSRRLAGWTPVAAALCAWLCLSMACYPNPNDLRAGSNSGSGTGTGGGGGHLVTGSGGHLGAGGTPAVSCTDASFPQACPALGTVPAGCWGSTVVCSTVTNCSGTYRGCSSATLKLYCAGDPTDQCCAPPAAGGLCNLPACGCATGQICAANTPATGLTCFAAGAGGEGAACSGTDCASGLGCFGGLCKKYCQVDTDCPAVDGARECEQTSWVSTGDDIPGVLICERVCDPVSPQTPKSPLLSCPTGYGCNVTALGSHVTFCGQRTGVGAAGSACTADDDCSAGYYCDITDAVCAKYCFGNGDCPAGSTCQIFSPAFYAGSAPLGVCGA
jgi:hypothetical protein